MLCDPGGTPAFAGSLRRARGIVASKIAAHAADIAKGVRGARKQDDAMAEARQRFDWEEQFRLAIDGEKAKAYYESVPASDKHSCSMCGKMCAMRTTSRILEGKTVEILQDETKEK